VDLGISIIVLGFFACVIVWLLGTIDQLEWQLLEVRVEEFRKGFQVGQHVTHIIEQHDHNTQPDLRIAQEAGWHTVNLGDS